MPLSFRDPENSALQFNGAWYRLASGRSAEELTEFRMTNLYTDLTQEAAIPAFEMSVNSEQLVDGCIKLNALRKPEGTLTVFSVDTVSHVTYPWEWSNRRLFEAGVFLLALRERLLTAGFDLKDAFAHNITFVNGKPILVDLGSITRWDNRPTWVAFRQFVEQFINPLAISANSSFASSDLYRINRLAGIHSLNARRTMRFRHRLSPRLALVQKIATPSKTTKKFVDFDKQSDSVLALRATTRQSQNLAKCLSQIYGWINPTMSTWREYSKREHYFIDDLERKKSFALRFVSSFGSKSLCVMDIGGNDGLIAKYLSDVTKNQVFVLDSDAGALEVGEAGLPPSSKVSMCRSDLFECLRASYEGAAEFPSLVSRIQPDVVLCHAVLHHVVITQAVPLVEVVKALRSLNCPIQVEFVDENDGKVQQLIADIRNWSGTYSRSDFEALCQSTFQEVRHVGTTSESRHVYELFPSLK